MSTEDTIVTTNDTTPTDTPTVTTEGNDTGLIAGKYKTQEDLNKGILALLQKQHGDNLADYYKSLESELGKKNNEKTDAAATDVSSNDSDTSTTDGGDNTDDGTVDTTDVVVDPNSVDDFVSKLGLNYKEMEATFNDTGALSQDHYQALANKGIPKQMVDNYLMLMNEYKDTQYKSIAAEVGGEEALNTVFNWVGETYTPEEIETYNKLMGSGNINVIKNTIKVLSNAYKEANGSAPEVSVNGSSVAKGNTFKTFKEYTAALAEAKRSGDKAKVEEVNAAMYRSRKGPNWNG